MLDLVLGLVSVPVGAAIGCVLGLVPGLYLGVVAAIVCAIVKVPAWASLGLAAAVGANVYSKRLSAVFSPAAGSPDLASIDPGVKLASEGRGREALAISTGAVDVVVAAGFFTLPLLGVAIAFAVDVKAVLEAIQGPVAVLAGLFWVGSLILRGHRAKARITVFVLTGMGLGYALVHHPAVVGDVHALTPLLLGAFAVPIALSLKQGGPLPEQKPLTRKLQINLETVAVGSVAGVVGGVAVGIGASSLASTVEGLYETEDFLSVAVAAEATNDLVALLLMAFIGAGRSGEAVAIANVTGTLSPLQGFSVLVAAGVGFVVGSAFVVKVQDLAIANAKNQQLALGIVLALGLGQLLLMQSWFVGLVFTGLFLVWALARGNVLRSAPSDCRHASRDNVPAQSLFAPFLGIAWGHALGENANRWVLDTQR